MCSVRVLMAVKPKKGKKKREFFFSGITTPRALASYAPCIFLPDPPKRIFWSWLAFAMATRQLMIHAQGRSARHCWWDAPKQNRLT